MPRGQPYWEPYLDTGDIVVNEWVEKQYKKYSETIYADSFPAIVNPSSKIYKVFYPKSQDLRPGYTRYAGVTIDKKYLTDEGIKALESGKLHLINVPKIPPCPYIRKAPKDNFEFWEMWLYFYWLNQVLGLYFPIGDYHKFNPSKNFFGSVARLTETSNRTVNYWFAKIKREAMSVDDFE